jgi:hypothetical protein
MADGWQTFPVEFTGGLITNMSPLQQGVNLPGSAQRLRNFEPSTDGGYRRISGFGKWDSALVDGSAGRIRGVIRFNGYAYAAKGSHLYRSDGSGSWTQVTDSVTFNSTGITLSGTGKVRFAVHNFGNTKTLLIIDGVTKPFKFDGTELAQITTATSDQEGATHVVEHKSHIFFSKNNLLSFSASLSDTDYTAASGAGSILMDNPITAILTFREQLIVFTSGSIFSVQGSSSSDWLVQPITRDIGAIKEDTVQEIGGDLMFLGPDGLRLLSATERNNDFGLGVVSKSIQPEVNAFVNTSSGFSSVVLRDKSQYRILGFSATNNASGLGLVCTQFSEQGGQNMAWSETQGINAFCSTSVVDAGEEFILFGNDDGYVYRMESGNSFDGGNIVATFKTPPFPISDPTTRKTFYKMRLFTDPLGSLEVAINPEYEFGQPGNVQPPQITIANTTSGTVALYGVGQYGSASYGGANLKYIFDVNLVGSAFVGAYTFTSDGIAPPFSFDSMIIQYGQYGRR